MSIDKQFHGGLDGSSKGEMMTAGGRTGSFTLHHNATMNPGAGDLNIIVVPDSGTDQLTGISGKITITITEGKHFYEFHYTLP